MQSIRQIILKVCELATTASIDELAVFFQSVSYPTEINAESSTLLLTELQNKLDAWTSFVATPQEAVAEPKVNLEQQIANIRHTYLSLYKPLHAAFIAHQIKIDPTQVYNSYSKPQDQLVEIQSYRHILQEQQTSLLLQQTQMQLYLLEPRKQILLEELKQFNLIGGDEPVLLEATICMKIEELKSLQKKLNKVQLLLAEAVTYRSKVQLLFDLSVLEKGITRLDSELQAIELDVTIKQQLHQQYSDSANVDELIASYQQHILPSTPTRTWSSLLFGNNEATISPLIINKHLFLKKIDERYQIELQIASLNTQLAVTSDVEPTIINLEQIAKLIQDVMRKIPDYKLELKEQQPAELFSVINNLIPLLAQQIVDLQHGLRITNQLSALNAQTLALLTKIGLIGNLDDFIPSQTDFQYLQHNSADRKNQLLQLSHDLKQCDEFLLKGREYIALLEANPAQTHKSNKRIKSKVRKPVEVNSQQLIEKEIYQIIEQLKALELPASIPQNSIPEPQLPKLNRDRFITLQNVCRPLTFRLPTDLRSWYSDLLPHLVNNTQENNKLYLKSLHFLTDLAYEINHNITEQPFSVIKRYQEICPNPKCDWQKLLDLKPAVPLESLPGVIQNVEIKKVFNALYTYAESKSSVKKEDILFKAIRNLHYLALRAEQRADKLEIVADLQFWRNDPHYAVLQKNQGIFLLFEYLAKLITAIGQRITGNNDWNYQDSCFFKKPRSIVLLDEATLRIGNSLGG